MTTAIKGLRVSDREIRARLLVENSPGVRVALRDLLSARAEIRRLRKALRYYYDIEGHYSDCTCGTCSALTPRRSKK